MKKTICMALATVMALTFMVGCNNTSTPSAPPIPDNETLGEIITSTRTEEAGTMLPVLISAEDDMAASTLEYIGLNPEDMQNWAVSVSMINIKTYGVAIIEPVEGKEQDILDALNNFVELQRKAMENYLADQYEVAKAATVETLDNGAILMVMDPNHDATRQTIIDALAANA